MGCGGEEKGYYIVALSDGNNRIQIKSPEAGADERRSAAGVFLVPRGHKQINGQISFDFCIDARNYVVQTNNLIVRNLSEVPLCR